MSTTAAVPDVVVPGGSVMLSGQALQLTAWACGRAAEVAVHGKQRHRLPPSQVADLQNLARLMLSVARTSSPTRTSEFAYADDVRRSSGGGNHISTREAARRTGLGQRRIQILCHQLSRVGGARRIGRFWMIDPAALDEYQNSQTIKEHNAFE